MKTMRAMVMLLLVALITTMCTSAGIAQPGVIAAKGLKLIDNNILPTRFIKLQTPSSLSSDHTFTLPPVSVGIFKSDGSGVMSIGPVNLSSEVTGTLSPGSITLAQNNILVGNASNVAQAYAPGAPNTVLSINGSGVPVWQTLADVGGISGSGTATQVAFFSGTVGNSSTTLSSSPNLFWNNTTGSLGVGGTPTTSSALSINSTSQGFLAPRMTVTERDAITTPATGLLVYQTNSSPGFYYFNGTAWVALIPSSGSVIGSTLFIRKPSDQTVSVTGVATTEANDNDLVFTVNANEAWEFEVIAYLSADNDAFGLLGLNAVSEGGIRLSNAAADASMVAENLTVSLLGIIGAGVEGQRFQDASAAGNHLKTFVTVNLGLLGATVSNTYVKFKGFVRAGGTSTTVNIRWREAISLGVVTATSVLTIQENSYLKATRVE